MNNPNDVPALLQLRQRGYRLTPQRLAIVQILEEDGGHLSPGEIFERAVKRMPGLTEPTVYRTLDFLARNGLVLVAHVGDGRLVYEVAGHNHHHLICHACGMTVMIDHHLLETLYTKFSEQTGFTIDHWHVTFFGLCPDCARNK
ncbi:MAG: transcriptional repressor [Anaerolineaceae bacterium]|nr:transcriptional repressor [Anaerolineaceae bacterium]